MKRLRHADRARLIGLVILLLLGGGAWVLVSSPRHRSFYSGLNRTPGPRAASATPSVASSPVVTSTPAPGPRGRGPSGQAMSIRVPAPDQAGRIRVPVADFVPTRLPASGVPFGWEVAEFSGADPSVELARTDGRLALRLRSERNSFALHRDVVLDLRTHPILSWSWKVLKLPHGGDVREAGRDDQAAQVYVVFPRWPSPRTTSDVVGYVWDGHAPVGTKLAHPRAPNVRIVVLESGPGRLDQWLREERNVAEDYRALFGRQPPRAGKVAIMIDSNDTRSDAEALFGDLTFSRAVLPGHTEIPTTMLR